MAMMQVATLVFATFFLVAGRVTAQAGDDCSAAYGILAPCYSYVNGPDTVVPPSCCSGVDQLNSQQPRCLCSAITQLQGSTGVNVTKALALPRDCNVPVDVNQCPAFATPPSNAARPPRASPPSDDGPSPPPMMPAPPMPPMMTPPAMGPSMMTPPGGATPPSDDASPPMMMTPPAMGPSMMSPPEGSPAMGPSMMSPPEGSAVPPSESVPGVVVDGPVAAPAGSVENSALTLSVSLSVFAAAASTLLRLL